VPSRRFRWAVNAALVVAMVAAVVVVVAAIVGDDESAGPPPAPTGTATPSPSPAPALDAPAPGPSLALGITEPNPNLVAAPGAREVPAQWARWRDELAAVRPTLYRLVIDWSAVQPRPGAPPDFDLAERGCMRAVPPCAPYGGVRDQLRAAASRGWTVLVVVTGTPSWAAAAPSGCRRVAGYGVPRADALTGYRELIAGVLAVAAQEGADLRYLSPWNEPNHPLFLAPQRAECDRTAPSLAAESYAELARALQAELAAQPGDQVLVLGETAGIVEPTARATSVQEMIAALPSDLVCAASVWSQHAYIGGTDPVAAVTAALDARGCPRQHAIWITETGVGTASEELSFARGIGSEREGCRLLHERLAAWYDDPRVTLAAQYTLREDDRFPTGLVTTDLGRARRALAEWQAWGARADAAAPPPAAAC